MKPTTVSNRAAAPHGGPPWDGRSLEHLARFARWHLASGDIDPVYPVLRWVIEDQGLDGEEALRLAVLYVVFYDLPSALTVWTDVGWPDPLPERYHRLPTGTERRAHRDPRQLLAHLAGVQARIDAYGSLGAWITTRMNDDPRQAWRATQELLRAVHGNGRWAAYKTGEVLASVLGWPLTPTDAGHDFSTGPRHGLELVYPRAATASVPELDAMTEQLGAELAERGVSMPVEQVETVLCDWHSTVRGRYYVGADIDLLQGQAARAQADIGGYIRRAREACFDARWLGEFGGWTGIRPELRTAYRDRGVIEWWDE